MGKKPKYPAQFDCLYRYYEHGVPTYVPAVCVRDNGWYTIKEKIEQTPGRYRPIKFYSYGLRYQDLDRFLASGQMAMMEPEEDIVISEEQLATIL